MKLNKDYIFGIFRRIIEQSGFFLIDLVIRGDNKLKIVEVFIDGEKGVTAKDCADISRALSSFIDAENFILDNYRLDISSPGVNKPLKFLQQYHKHLGRKFEIIYSEGNTEIKFEGKLTEIEGDELKFVFAKKEIILNFSKIIIAKVLISF